MSVHCLEYEVNCLQKLTHSALEESLLLRLEILRLSHLLCQHRVRVEYCFLWRFSILLLGHYLVLVKVLKATGEHLTDLHPVLH